MNLKAEPASVNGPWDRIAVLRNEAEAERLDLELNNLKIPHLMISYADSALDGLFQSTHGWGQTEAPHEHREAVLTILHDIRQAAAAPEESL